MSGHSSTLKDCNLEQSTIVSLKREPACFAFMCSRAISAPMPIDSINLDLASADYFAGRASLWTTLEMRSAAVDDRPTAVLGFDDAFLRPFTRALVEAATTRISYRMRIVDAHDNAQRHRVVEYVTGAGAPLRELVFTPHEHVIHIGLGILDLDIEVSVVIENARIDQLELHRGRAATTRVLLDQPVVGISGLRQLVEHARVSVAGDRIKIIV